MDYITTKYGCRVPTQTQEIDLIMETITNNTYTGISNLVESALLIQEKIQERLEYLSPNAVYNEYLQVQYSAPRQCGSTTGALACAYNYKQRGYDIYYIVHNHHMACSLRDIYPELYEDMVVCPTDDSILNKLFKIGTDDNRDTIVFHDTFSATYKRWKMNTKDLYYHELFNKMYRVRGNNKKFLHVKIQ